MVIRILSFHLISNASKIQMKMNLLKKFVSSSSSWWYGGDDNKNKLAHFQWLSQA